MSPSKATTTLGAFALAAIAATTIPGKANAGPLEPGQLVTVSDVGSTAFGTNGYAPVTISYTGGAPPSSITETVDSGIFDLDINGTAYNQVGCFDIFRTLQLPSPYLVTNLSVPASEEKILNRIFGNITPGNSAASSLAIWEAEYDPMGTFTASGNPALESQAATILTDASNGTLPFDPDIAGFYALVGQLPAYEADTQTLIVPYEVPEPALVDLGMLALGAAATIGLALRPKRGPAPNREAELTPV